MFKTDRKMLLFGCFAHTIQFVVHKFSENNQLQQLTKRMTKALVKMPPVKLEDFGNYRAQTITQLSQTTQQRQNCFQYLSRLQSLHHYAQNAIEGLHCLLLLGRFWRNFLYWKVFLQYYHGITMEEVNNAPCAKQLLLLPLVPPSLTYLLKVVRMEV